MSESSSGGGIVGEIHTAHRVTELEIEVARLVAELDEARGKLAASTIEQAVSEVTHEAEEAAARVRADIEQSQLEAREAVATAHTETGAARAAAAQVTIGARQELEKARTSAMTLAEEAAAGAEETKRRAKAEAEQILAVARTEATMAMTSERQRFTREVGALTGVREALIKERHALEQYHLQLQARVRELAQAIVAFMANTSEHESPDALAKLTMPEIEAPPEAVTVPLVTVDEVMDPGAAPTDMADPESVGSRPEDLPSDTFGLDPFGGSTTAGLGSSMTPPMASPRPVVEAVPPRPESEPAPAAAIQEDPWREVDPSKGPPRPLFGTPIAASAPSGSDVDNDLFAPARPGDGSSAEPGGLGRLVAEGGGRVAHVETEGQTTSEADAQFQEFIDGDDDDASRSWFLRSDKS